MKKLLVMLLINYSFLINAMILGDVGRYKINKS
jgi:hypothetical protein